MGFTLKNRWAVVTGASSGIGREIACVLAAQGCHLFLVARREEMLRDLSVALAEQYGVDVKWRPIDLTIPSAPADLAEQLEQLPISIVVNNAGFAVAGSFESSDFNAISRMIDLNIRFLTGFCRLMLPRLKARKDGARIMNVGSVAGHQGVPNMAAYAATKAYVNHFTEGLNWELRGTGVAVTSLEPGQTASEFFDVAGVSDVFMAQFGVLRPEAVARIGVSVMVKGKPRHVVGFLNKLLIFSLRITPRFMVRMVITRLFRDWA